MSFIKKILNIQSPSNPCIDREIHEFNKVLCEFNNTLDRIAKDEIKSKDRVDISKDEYERLIALNSRLNSENARLRGLLAKFKIPFDKPIIEDSIKTCYTIDPIEFQTIYQVVFAVSDFEKE